MGGLFGILDGFFASLTTFLTRIEGYVPFLSTPSTDFMRFFFMFTLCLFALNNVFSIYNIEGDSRFTVLFFLGIQVAAAGSIFIVTSAVVASLLGGVTVL
jgi:archaellum biogenesis protein FlaJ (TadC family)